ncbi:MAG: PIN domain-containing protein [Thermoplasmatales archaeon]|nr:PIN domain-containing protein [Thermoplasmatales archaeon]
MNYKLYRLLGSKESMKRTLKILSSEYVNYIPIEKDTIIEAVTLSYSRNIRINDAIIARHAMDSNASLLTDNIKDFKKISRLNLIPLKD